MSSWKRVLDFWDKDWKGDSWNGRNLRDELAAHSPAQASDSGSLEGYTVWGIALHVLRASSWGKAFTWASSHDVYHVAQIRNMKPAA